jgi:1,2-diacylglycerol 3-beta-glucosyltransferase
VLLEAGHLAASGSTSGAAPLLFVGITCAAAYVLRGVAFSGTGWRGLLGLVFAPVYVAWKIAVARPWRAKSDPWVRTAR